MAAEARSVLLARVAEHADARLTPLAKFVMCTCFAHVVSYMAHVSISNDTRPEPPAQCHNFLLSPSIYGLDSLTTKARARCRSKATVCLVPQKPSPTSWSRGFFASYFDDG